MPDLERQSCRRRKAYVRSGRWSCGRAERDTDRSLICSSKKQGATAMDPVRFTRIRSITRHEYFPNLTQREQGWLWSRVRATGAEFQVIAARPACSAAQKIEERVMIEPSTNHKPAALPSKWDETVDVIVIGSGFAGLSAAIEAHDAGASVKIIEKMDKPGGNSWINGGQVAAAGSALQKKQGIKDFARSDVQGHARGGPQPQLSASGAYRRRTIERRGRMDHEACRRRNIKIRST